MQKELFENYNEQKREQPTILINGKKLLEISFNFIPAESERIKTKRKSAIELLQTLEEPATKKDIPTLYKLEEIAREIKELCSIKILYGKTKQEQEIHTIGEINISKAIITIHSILRALRGEQGEPSKTDHYYR